MTKNRETHGRTVRVRKLLYLFKKGSMLMIDDRGES